jgi:anti-anti-sigma factor
MLLSPALCGERLRSTTGGLPAVGRAASSPALEQELERGAASSAEQVIVDLRGLEFMGSTGLSVLVRAHQRAIEKGQRFGVVKGLSRCNAC